jgi:transposase
VPKAKLLPLLVRHGWRLHAPPLFLDQLEWLLRAVERARKADPDGWRGKADAKLLAALRGLVLDRIPRDPLASEFRQGNTLGPGHRYWFRAKFGANRFRLFFRADSRARVHARHVAAALSLQVNKTDTNDAHGIAQVVRSGWYRPVAVKSMQSCRVRAILAARRQLVEVRTSLYSQIRGLLKTFGVALGSEARGTFERAVNAECPDDSMVRDAVGALLSAWKVAGERKVALERQLVRIAREHDVCRRLATVPGVGAITSLSFVTALDDPTRFRRSCDMGAYLGLTPKRYQSGEVDLAGRISKSGERADDAGAQTLHPA